MKRPKHAPPINYKKNQSKLQKLFRFENLRSIFLETKQREREREREIYIPKRECWFLNRVLEAAPWELSSSSSSRERVEKSPRIGSERE